MRTDIMRFFKKKTPQLPASVNMGMHISEDEAVRPVHVLMRSAVALAGVIGTLMSFMTAWEKREIFSFDKKSVMITAVCCWLLFSVIFSIRSLSRDTARGRRSSRVLSCACVICLLGVGLLNFQKLAAGYMNAANKFMETLFLRYSEAPPYQLAPEFEALADKYTQFTMCMAGALITLIICSGSVRKPNSLLFFGAAVPLPELCLYFGLIPDHFCFGLLMVSLCGVIAAEITEYGTFSDRSAARLFARTSSQSGAAAALIMLAAFGCAMFISRDHERPQRLDDFRAGFIEYMKNFTWEKFVEDVADSVMPSDKRTATHDGKLGNNDNLEFTGRNMLEVTVPEGISVLYLKGFTGVEYNGSRWSEGPPVPALQTPLTSAELFSGRGLKYVDGLSALAPENVIVRNTGISNNTKYYPSNAVGLLETDGIRRRYGVYFPDEAVWQKLVLNNADNIVYPDDMAEDEQRLRTYAYTYCLDVPATFTAGEEFFTDYKGDSLADELMFIRKKLAQDNDYTLDSGKKPFGSDFAQWFLTENHKGSCTHFASAAVLLCRTRGIPARYCEGFVIKPEDISSYEPENGYVTLTVPDNRAHAWVEVYVNGYGWLRYEVTPGYGNVALTSPNEEWDMTSASEITEVSTEPPSFSEHITSPEPETEISQSVTAVTTELTTIESVSLTIDPDASDTQFSGSEVQPEFPEEENISTRPPAQNGQSPSGSDNGTGPHSEEPSYGGQPEQTTSTSAPDNNNEELHKGLDPETVDAVIKVLAYIAAAAAVCIVIYLRRVVILSHRRKLTAACPEKASAGIYRMLMQLAKKHGADISVSTDILADSISECEGFDKAHCTCIINTALKARFGQGISSEEALISCDAYNFIADKVMTDKLTVFMAVVVFVNDRYI